MVDQNNREPAAAAATIAFFSLGHIFQWFGEPHNLQLIKDVLSIISFSVSIVVGIKTLQHKFNKRKSS